MVVENIRYAIPEERRAAFLAAYATASAALDAAPQCLAYELTQGVEEPGNFVMRIEWTSVEDHERGFRGGPHFGPFLASVRPFISQIAEMKHYRQTDVAHRTP